MLILVCGEEEPASVVLYTIYLHTSSKYIYIYIYAYIFGSLLELRNLEWVRPIETIARVGIEDRLRKKELYAVIKFGVDERGCDGASSGKVESVSILRISRIDRKSDLETEEIWSDNERVESKITPRLRADWAGVIATFEEKALEEMDQRF